MSPTRSPTANRIVAWLKLLALSAVVTLILEGLHLPAAFLLGPMIAAIITTRWGETVTVPSAGFLGAQAVVGAMIARSMPASVLIEVVRDWPLYLSAVGAVMLACTGVGWLFMRRQILPGSTALWGLSPGAATAMMVMADAYGADIRLVAFMQYLRVLVISLVAVLVARIWVPNAGAGAAIVWFPPVPLMSAAAIVALIAIAVFVAPRTKVPAGPFMLPLGAAMALQDLGGFMIDLPPWLLVTSYALIGWSTGLRFTRPILAHAIRTLPQILAAIVSLVAVCAGLAVLLVWVAHVDPLTAYLAMSPGGMDTTAIIAAASPVDLPFVMAMQATRFFLVILVGPSLAALVVRLSGGRR